MYPGTDPLFEGNFDSGTIILSVVGRALFDIPIDEDYGEVRILVRL